MRGGAVHRPGDLRAAVGREAGEDIVVRQFPPAQQGAAHGPQPEDPRGGSDFGAAGGGVPDTMGSIRCSVEKLLLGKKMKVKDITFVFEFRRAGWSYRRDWLPALTEGRFSELVGGST